MPSWCNPGQARGVRVVGYLASGPTGAATSVLRQQVLIAAKLRGRQSIFLLGVIAASPCCTWYTNRSAEVQPIYRLYALHDLHPPSPEASTLCSCQSTFAQYWLQWHAPASVLASVRSCSFPQWALCVHTVLSFSTLPSATCPTKKHRIGVPPQPGQRVGLGVPVARYERPCDLARAQEARTRNRHPWLCARLLRPSLRCRRFVQLLPRRGTPRRKSLSLRLGGSFREVSRQKRWPSTIVRALCSRPMLITSLRHRFPRPLPRPLLKPLSEHFKPCFGHLRVSRHLRHERGSLMLTSTGMESTSRCSYALLVTRRFRSWVGWIIRKRPMQCLCCYLHLSLMLPVLPPSSHWTLYWGHHACLPGACEPRSLPQPALSGCRLSAMSLCSHKLTFSPRRRLLGDSGLPDCQCMDWISCGP